MAVMTLGKLIVVTRLVATGTDTAVRSSSKTCWMAGESASATAAVNTDRVKDRILVVDFIFEVAHGGGEASVQGHVGVADEAQPERERKRLGKRLVLKNAGANDLAADSGQHLAFARGQNVYAADLDFLVQLFGAKLDRFLDVFILRLGQGGFEKQQLEQIGIVEVLRVAFEESHGGEFGLLEVQILRLGKLEQRTQVIRSGGINDDDALALFELGHDVVAVNRREQQHRYGEEKPEPRQPVALDQQAGRIKAAWHRPGGGGTLGFGGSYFGGVHRSVIIGFGSGDEVADGFVAGDVVTGPAARGARRQAGTGDDDGARAAHVGGGRHGA